MTVRTRLALVVTMALNSAAALAVVWQAVFSRIIGLNGGCGYDGNYYCQAFHGLVIPAPWVRRILAPRLAAVISGDPITGFRVIDAFAIAGILATAAALVLLTAQPRAGRFWTAGRTIAAAVTISVVLSSRDLVRFVFHYPVITDALALFLLLLAIYGILRMGRSPWFVAVAAAAAFLAPLARENYGIPILGGALATGLLRRASWPRIAAVGAATLAGTYVAFSQVSSAPEDPVVHVMWRWIVMDFSTPLGVARFGAMLMIGLGFFWVPLALPRFWRAVQRDELVLLAVAGVFTAVSVFGGGDTDRIMMPVGFLLCITVARVAVREPSTFGLPLALLAVAYFIVQCPFVTIADSQWISFFSLHAAERRELANNGVGPVLLAAPAAIAAVLGFWRSDEERTAVADPEPGRPPHQLPRQDSVPAS